MQKLNWLASYPKSGNTWVRCFLRAYQYDAYEPIDINSIGKISKSACRLRYFLELSDKTTLDNEEIDALRAQVQKRLAERIGHHQVVKTHNARTTNRGYPLIQVPYTRCAIYVVRNPLDIVDSFADHVGTAHHAAVQMMANPAQILDDAKGVFVRQYLDTWSGHVLSWTEKTPFPVLVLRYEDLIRDGFTYFSRLIRFLGWFFDEDRVKRAMQWSSFSELRAAENTRGFKETSSVSTSRRFFRQGQVDAWKSVLDDQLVRRIVDDHGSVMARMNYATDYP